MSYPSFTTGEILTAADMNAVGLWQVSTGSFTNAASFDVIGFTSTYQNFRLLLTVGRTTGTGGAAILGTARTASSGYTTNYFGAGWRVIFNGTSGAVGTRNAGADFDTVPLQSSTAQTLMACEIAGMNTTSREFCIIGHAYDFANSGSTTFGYQCTNLTLDLDRIRFSCSVNMTGNWRLYGYKN